MPQVPETCYLIIGNGRVARHFCYYFDQLDLCYKTWARATHSAAELATALAKASHVIVAISDSAIEDFIKSTLLPQCDSQILLHCSGALLSEHAIGVHPLQTFSHDLYPLDYYQAVPFIIDNSAMTFAELLPGLNNPHSYIKPEDKPYYHALCVIANNFTTLIWQKCFTSMQEKLAISPELLKPILAKTFENIAKDPHTALTGPIARQDSVTLERNLLALVENNDNYKTIFQAFINTYTN